MKYHALEKNDTILLTLFVCFSVVCADPMLNAFAQSTPDEIPTKNGLIIAEVELDSTNGSQWFKVYNPTDHLIHLGTMYVNSSDGIHYLQMATAESGLPPKQFQVLCLTVTCDQSILPKNEVWPRVNDTITIYPYPPGIRGNQPPLLWDRTTPLTDTFSDSRTWQFDGNQWTFAEQNTVTVPEFPFVIPILLIGVASLIIFTRLRFGKI